MAAARKIPYLQQILKSCCQPPAIVANTELPTFENSYIQWPKLKLTITEKAEQETICFCVTFTIYFGLWYNVANCLSKSNNGLMGCYLPDDIFYLHVIKKNPAAYLYTLCLSSRGCTPFFSRPLGSSVVWRVQGVPQPQAQNS